MTHITSIGPAGIALIKASESLRLKPYLDSAGIPTIGWGSTYYQDGRRVTMQDAPITASGADLLLKFHLAHFEKNVDSITTDAVNQNQFDALVSFAYNCGIGNLRSSMLLKKVNANPNDPAIRAEFMKWVYAGGKKVQGLVNRRAAEADLYFKLNSNIITLTRCPGNGQT